MLSHCQRDGGPAAVITYLPSTADFPSRILAQSADDIGGDTEFDRWLNALRIRIVFSPVPLCVLKRELQLIN